MRRTLRSWIITKAMKTMNDSKSKRIPIHNYAAAMLEDMLDDFGLSVNALASAIQVPVQRVSDVLGERRMITPDLALRLGQYFGNRPDYWLDLQNEWLLRKAKRRSASVLKKIVPLATAP